MIAALCFLVASQTLIATAHAAAPIPVQLPASEAGTGWPLTLVDTGLILGVPAGFGVTVTETGDGATWQVHVTDPSGASQDLAVLIPANAQEREDLAWYLAKLAGAHPPEIRPLTAPAAPVQEPVAQAPVAAAPVQAPVAQAPVAQAPVATLSPELLAQIPVARSLTPVPKTEAAPQFFARIAGSAGVRGKTRAAIVPELTLGLHAGLLRAGAYGAMRSAAEVSGVGADKGYSALEAGAGVWAMPDFPVGGGILGGVSVRSFTADGAQVTTIALPVVAAEALGHFTLGKTGLASHIGVEPLLRAQMDLRSVELQLRRGDTVASTVVLPGWELRFGVGFTWN